jgi:alpha-L-arabinofuranosidase
MRTLKADIIDEHYYMDPKWFLDNVARYDKYPRTGPKVFAGEFAAQTAGIARIENRNNWDGALAEAAFMTGLERNADLVVMASYAPLFGHVDAWQWTPNMIWFDNLRSYATPNYYVQKLFSVNKGTAILPVLLNDSPKNDNNDLFASASFDEPTGEIILKVVNATASPRKTTLDFAGVKQLGKNGKSFVLTAPDLKAENTLDEPVRVAPVENKIMIASNKFTHTFAPNSLTVLRIGQTGRKP